MLNKKNTVQQIVRGFSILAFITAAPLALAQSQMDKMPSNMSGMGHSDMQSSMKSMMSKMDSMKMTGNVDRDFAMMMKEHHQGAIAMAQIEIKNGKDKKLQQMAQKIIRDQEKEIKELDHWLADNK